MQQTTSITQSSIGYLMTWRRNCTEPERPATTSSSRLAATGSRSSRWRHRTLSAAVVASHRRRRSSHGSRGRRWRHIPGEWRRPRGGLSISRRGRMTSRRWRHQCVARPTRHDTTYSRGNNVYRSAGGRSVTRRKWNEKPLEASLSIRLKWHLNKPPDDCCTRISQLWRPTDRLTRSLDRHAPVRPPASSHDHASS